MQQKWYFFDYLGEFKMIRDRNFPLNSNSNRDWDLFERRTEAEIFEDELEDQFRKDQRDGFIKSHTESMTNKNPKNPELEAQQCEMYYQFFTIYFTQYFRQIELYDHMVKGITRRVIKDLNEIKDILTYLLLDFENEDEEEWRIEWYEQIMREVTREVMKGPNELKTKLKNLLLYSQEPIELSEPKAKGMTRQVLKQQNQQIDALKNRLFLRFF
jgi:hypothetical protein